MSLRRAILAGGLAILWGNEAVASAAAVADCLDAVDVPCAKRVIAAHTIDESSDAELVYMAARTSFFGGEFEQAYQRIARAVELGHDDRWDEAALYERTWRVHEGFVEAKRGDRAVVRYAPGLDAVMVEEVLDAIERSEEHLGDLLGGRPPGPIVVEIYPSGKAFTEASSLTEADVKTTGVVALSKWSRILLTSPRALGRGYGWGDTVAHEYIHQVISHHTHDRAPVWLQEGIAKYLDNRWETGEDRFALDPRAESLLAKAIQEDQLIPFERMHPSLAKLPSAEMASLAYAQLASLLQFIVEKEGEDVLPAVLKSVDAMEDPRVALSKHAGFRSFKALEDGWKSWAVTQGLRERAVAASANTLDSSSDVDIDPVLSQRRDLARFLRLGELLLERGHHEAALIEFAKANQEEGQTSPLLQTRIAQAHLALGDRATARTQLEYTLSLYPEFTLAWRAMGDLEREMKRPGQAIRAYQRVVDLDPFDAGAHEHLITLLSAAGQAGRAARHREQVAILRRGGEG